MTSFIAKALLSISLLTLASCTNGQNDDNAESVGEQSNKEQTAEQAQYVLPQKFSVQAIAIETESEDILLEYENDTWEATGLENPDAESISLFAEKMLSIVGTPVDEQLSEKTTFTLSNSEESIEVALGNAGEVSLIRVDEQVFEVAKMPLEMKPFASVFLEESVKLGIDEWNEIIFENEEETITLSQTTSMNEVEKLPFLSGWYLNDVFETDFSIEYYWMNTLLGQLTELKAIPSDSTVETTTQRVILKGNEFEEILHIGKESQNGKTRVYLENKDQTVVMPSQITDLFQFKPLEITDNFVALIPLDAVETIEINTPNKDYSIRVDRSFEVTDNETEITSSFYLNDEEIPEKEFRRTYQYLARLSYSDVLTENEKQQMDEEAPIEFIYEYMVDGETLEKSVKLLPIEGSEEYGVEKDGIVEFKMTDEKLNEMFTAFDDMNN